MQLFVHILNQSIRRILDEIEHSTVVRNVMEKKYTILLAINLLNIYKSKEIKSSLAFILQSPSLACILLIRV